MKRFWAFVVTPVILTTIAELVLKYTINSIGETHSSPQLIVFLTNPIILASVLAVMAGGVLWVIGLSSFELSFMYPFLTVNYFGIIIGSIVFLHEQVSMYSLLAVCFILIGLLIISRSKYQIKGDQK